MWCVHPSSCFFSYCSKLRLQRLQCTATLTWTILFVDLLFRFFIVVCTVYWGQNQNENIKINGTINRQFRKSGPFIAIMHCNLKCTAHAGNFFPWIFFIHVQENVRVMKFQKISYKYLSYSTEKGFKKGL